MFITNMLNFSQQVSKNKNIFTPAHRLMSFVPSSIDVPYLRGMDYGVGVNLLQANMAGKAVITSEIKEVLNAGGQDITYNVNTLDTLEQLYRNVDISSSGGGSYKIFSGGFKARSHEESMFNSHSSFVLAYASGVNAFKQFTDGKLENDAVSLLRNGRTKDFQERYGDTFVRGLLTGGELYAIISITTMDKTEQTEIAGAIRAGITNLVNARVNMNEIKRNASSAVKIQIFTRQQGGVGPEQEFIGEDFQKLCRRLQEFPSIIQNHPLPISAQLASYKTLDNYPANVNPVDIENREQSLSNYMRLRSQYITIKNDVEFVQLYPDYYENPPNAEVLNQWQRYFADKINDVEAQRRMCNKDLDNCKTIAFELPNNLKMPSRKSTAVLGNESELLGRFWNETEEDWRGLWVRRGLTRIFDAEWTLGTAKETAVLEIHINGNQITVMRQNTSSTHNNQGHCSYTGTITNGTIRGTYSCDWAGNNTFPWQAQIISARMDASPEVIRTVSNRPTI